MTAQVPDRFNYNQKQYSLAGINGTGLFCPSEHGMILKSPHTACWRGYVAYYEIKDDFLKMRALNVWAEDIEELPLLVYGAPLKIREGEVDCPIEGSFDGVYGRCPEVVPFTGGILLADGFIQEFYEHMGFHPAWKYREVHEIIFEGGVVLKKKDLSARFKEYREKQDGTRPRFASAAEQLNWIAKTFDLSYKDLEPD